jgi:hypothetical protein
VEELVSAGGFAEYKPGGNMKKMIRLKHRILKALPVKILFIPVIIKSADILDFKDINYKKNYS